MSKYELGGKAQHLISILQGKFAATANTTSKLKPNLHWGQFVVEPKPDAQVGVYGSACAAFLLRLQGRDDPIARDAVENLAAFAKTPDAINELAHNIKLGMVVLALAPDPGARASELMLMQLELLLDRYSQPVKLWPAYTKPAQFEAVPFAGRASEVASAVLVILLTEVRRRLTHESHLMLGGKLDAMLTATAGALENAFAANRTVLARHGTLIATAVILVKGSEARRAINAAFKDAVRKREFADRPVFFYDCLRLDGSPSRDYFILPPTIILPMVAAVRTASPMQRALALDVATAMLRQLDDDGLFRGGQDMPSTVEQGMAGLSLCAVARGERVGTGMLHLAGAWVYMSQSSPTGAPTKLVGTAVGVLWAATALLLLGKYIPSGYHDVEGLKQAYALSHAAPDPISQFLAFVCGAWPASRAVLMRVFGWA